MIIIMIIIIIIIITIIIIIIMYNLPWHYHDYLYETRLRTFILKCIRKQ